MEVNRRRTKLPHAVIIKAPGLLPMLYTPREICEELGVAESTLRDWLQKICNITLLNSFGSAETWT